MFRVGKQWMTTQLNSQKTIGDTLTTSWALFILRSDTGTELKLISDRDPSSQLLLSHSCLLRFVTQREKKNMPVDMCHSI